MRILPWLLISLFFTVQAAFAGLPPTCIQGSNDASCLTSFFFQYPNVTFTHSGSTATFGTVGYGSGGTGATSWTVGSVLFSGASAFQQDNANFFWDATNHRLGVGNSAPAASIDIKSSTDDNAHGIQFHPAAGLENFALYMSTDSSLTITDPHQGSTIFGVNNQGRVTLGSAAFGHPDATVLMENQVGITTIPTLAFKKQTLQTADFFDAYDTDEVTKLFNVDITGKVFAPGAQFSGLTASQAVVTDASKNVASLAYGSASVASTLVQRDANQNTYANNFISAMGTVVSAAGTTTLNANSPRVEILTGTTTQTFKLPSASTFPATGATFEFNNNSTGLLTVNDANNGLVTTVLPGAYARVINTDNGTPAGVWDYHFLVPKNSSWGTAGATVTGTLNVTGTTTLATSLTGVTRAAAGVISAAELSGDATTSGSNAVTVAKVNGVSYGASPATNTVPVVTGANTVTYEAVPNAALANSSTTINGTACTLGSSCTVTASATGSTSSAYYDGNNGFGSTSTVNRRFITQEAAVGSGADWSFTDDAAKGSFLTILTAGTWDIEYWDCSTAGAGNLVIVINETLPYTTVPLSSTYANGRRGAISGSGAAGQSGHSHFHGRLAVNDIVYFTGNGLDNTGCGANSGFHAQLVVK